MQQQDHEQQPITRRRDDRRKSSLDRLRPECRHPPQRKPQRPLSALELQAPHDSSCRSLSALRRRAAVAWRILAGIPRRRLARSSALDLLAISAPQRCWDALADVLERDFRDPAAPGVCGVHAPTAPIAAELHDRANRAKLLDRAGAAVHWWRARRSTVLVLAACVARSQPRPGAISPPVDPQQP